jgi:hypothetical protein
MAKNTCTISGTIRSENCAMTAFRSPVPQEETTRTPGPGPDSAPIAAAPRPRARLATTGALLKHRARTTYQIPPTERVLRSPLEPRKGLRTRSRDRLWLLRAGPSAVAAEVCSRATSARRLVVERDR